MNTAGRLLSIYDSLVRKGHNTDVAMMKVWAEVFELQPDDPHLEDDVVTCLQATRVLEWALDLEGRGIVGEGMSFTPQEKQAVQQQHYHFGNVSGSQIQISSNGSTQTQANTTGSDLEALKGLIEALGAALERAQGDAADELRAELATLTVMTLAVHPG